MTALILASGSWIRAEMLKNSGVDFTVETSNVNESEIKLRLLHDKAKPEEIATALAKSKAMDVSRNHPGQFVLGADQILVFEGRIFDKPQTIAEAHEHLGQLRGKTHELLSAAVVVQGQKPLWQTIGRARLTMRDFSDDFLDRYINEQSSDLLTTVGAYKLEGAGAQLFDKVEGDYFSVLGLPLLEVLGFLRNNKVCLT